MPRESPTKAAPGLTAGTHTAPQLHPSDKAQSRFQGLESVTT